MSVNGPERSRGTVYGAPENAPGRGAIVGPPGTPTLTDASGETRVMAEKWLATVSDTQSKNSELQRVQAMAMDRMRAENAQLSTEVTTLKDAKAQLEAKVEEATRMNDALARQAAVFKNNLERALEDVAALKAAAGAHEAERAALQQTREELRAAKAEIATLSARVEQLNGTAADLSSKHADAMRAHADAVSAHAAVTEMLEDEKQKRIALLEQHNVLVDKHNALRAQAAADEARAEETRAEMASAHAAVSEMLSAEKEKHNALAEQHSALTENYNALRAQATSDKERAEATRAELTNAHAAVNEMLSAEKEKHNALAEQHGTLTERYNALRAQATATEERAAETRAELDATRAKLEATKEKLRLLAKAHEAMAAEHATLRAEHAALVDKHDALSARHDALVAQSRVDKSELAEHIATSSALEHEGTELKAQLAACDATSTTASASATEQRAANAESQRAAELLNTRAVEAEARLEAALRQRDDELARLKETYESEKVSLQKEIGACTTEVEKLHSAHLEHIEATKGEKEKLATSNGVLDGELRSVKDRHIKFVSDAMEMVTLLNLVHGFTPRMDPSGKMELPDMVDQLQPKMQTGDA